MSNTDDLIQRAKKVSLNTYPLQPVVMDHGQGCYLYDTDGKEYLDFAAGIAVTSLGHAHPKLVQAIETQINKFMMCPASYMTEPRVKAAELLVENSCADQVFFCNSGAEAIEASLKLARLWAHKNKAEDCKEFIAFGNSFHGRTMGAVSVTEKSRLYPQFGPYLTAHFGTFNDVDSIKPFISDKICGIIVEPVQGEGGITPSTPEFLQGLRALCDEHNIALIFDQVQCGMCRTGRLFSHDHFDVEGDIISLAKGIGSGFPVGAMIAKDKFANAMELGMHGTTYGGNPVACAVICAVMEEFLKPGFMENINTMGKRLVSGLKDIQSRSNKIEEVRGLGLMIGADLRIPVKDFLGQLRENGMMATQAGSKTLRLTPALIAKEKEIDLALEKIEATLQSF